MRIALDLQMKKLFAMDRYVPEKIRVKFAN